MRKTALTMLCVLMAAALLSGCFLFNEGIAPAPDSVPESPPASAESQLPAVNPPSGGSQAAGSASSGVEIGTYTLVVPEGFTLPKIGMTLEEMGVCTAQEFIAATQTGDFSGYSLMAARAANPNRCYQLEGYLFPATYEFWNGTPIEDIVRTMLNAAEERIGGVGEAIAQSGYTADEILTLASVIEREAYGEESMSMISSVLHNRLAAGMPLQCDVSISYVENVIKPFIDGDKNRYNDYYNTYKCPALPAGPICNPGMAAIRAALNPADTNYLYFLTDANNKFYYAEDWEGHKANGAAAGISVE